MSDTTITEADVKRATAVINAAMKHGLYPDGAMPEADTDKVVEAERLIVLAEQSKRIADEVGKGNVSQYHGFEDILFEGRVTMGIGSEPKPPPQDLGEMHMTARPSTNDLVFMHVGCNGCATTSVFSLEGIDVSKYEGTAVLCANCSLQIPVTRIEVEHLPVEPEEAEGFAPETGDVWLDVNRNPWTVKHGGGGPQVEVVSASGEITMVPTGFLKERVSQAQLQPQLQPEQEKEPSTQEPSSPPSSQPAPPSEPSTSPSSSTTEAPPTKDSGQASPPPSQQASPPSSSTPSAPAEIVDNADGDPEYRKLLDKVDTLYAPKAMPTPMELEQPPSHMPDDLTALGPAENRRLHSQFNALAARARYLHAIEHAKARDCGRIRKLHMKPAMRNARLRLGKDATLTELTQDAEDNESVATWAERERHHSDRAEAYETFFNIYTENVRTLSRDYSMRDAEAQGA